MPNDTFKPRIFTSSQIADESTIRDGQFIINPSDGKMYLDYNGVRHPIGGENGNGGNTDITVTTFKTFVINGSTCLIMPYGGNDSNAEMVTIPFTSLNISGSCPVQLYDDMGYEIGSGSDILIQWNDSDLTIISYNGIPYNANWTVKLFHTNSVPDFVFNSNTDGFEDIADSGFIATFTKEQLGVGNTEPIAQLYDNNGYEIGSGSDISMRWNPYSGSLEIQSIAEISGEWIIKFA